MGRFEQLLAQCEQLKLRIKELKTLEVNQHEQGFKELQLKILKRYLTETGWELNRLTIYRSNND